MGRRGGVVLQILVLLAADASAQTDPEPHVVAVRAGEVDIVPVTAAVKGQAIRFATSRLLGEVVSVHDNTATVRLPIDVEVHVGDSAMLEQRRGGGVDVFPPHPFGWSLSAQFGIAPVSEATPSTQAAWYFQMAGSAEVVYRARVPFALWATVSHAGFAMARPSDIFVLDATAGISFDRREFEVGLGSGVLTFNAGDTSTTLHFALEPRFRIGAIDGFSLTATLQWLWLDSGSFATHAFEFAGGFGALSIPVGPGYWLVARGGFSLDCVARADFALRHLVSGNGRHGSTFISFWLGAMMTSFWPADETMVGPMGGIGIEVRP